VLEQLDEESTANLAAALRLTNQEVSNADIARAIRLEFGKPIDPTTVSTHRKGMCRCSQI